MSQQHGDGKKRTKMYGISFEGKENEYGFGKQFYKESVVLQRNPLAYQKSVKL